MSLLVRAGYFFQTLTLTCFVSSPCVPFVPHSFPVPQQQHHINMSSPTQTTKNDSAVEAAGTAAGTTATAATTVTTAAPDGPPPAKKQKIAVALPETPKLKAPPSVAPKCVRTFREMDPETDGNGKVLQWIINEDNSLVLKEGTWNYDDLGSNEEFKNLVEIAKERRGKHQFNSYSEALMAVETQLQIINDGSMYFTEGVCGQCYAPAYHGYTLDQLNEIFEDDEDLDIWQFCCEGCG